jgi:glutamyl/glutaminyl-tRNA synthetase
MYVWGATRARHGAVLLRIEDHDRQRSRAEFEAAIVSDLEWLAGSPDAQAWCWFTADAPLVRQSERSEIYADALASLRKKGLVYACTCTRAEIATSTSGDERCYPGTCRDRGIEERPGVSLRVRLEPSLERFTDLRHGPQAQRPSEQCGDLLVRDRESNWTYQFAATVDDYVQGVTLVVRGDDLLPSTGRQIQLARLLGRAEPPQFLHHRLIMKSPAQKLSKSDRDTALRDLRAQGFSAQDVIDRAASLAGLTRPWHFG